jgi:hypothetical protein
MMHANIHQVYLLERCTCLQRSDCFHRRPHPNHPLRRAPLDT